jgi:hypothetical protein
MPANEIKHGLLQRANNLADDIMNHIRIHQPTDDDIQILNSRISAPLLSTDPIHIIIRRYKLRNALNAEKLRQASEMSGASIIHYVAEIMNRTRMTLSDIYALKGGTMKFKSDDILSVIIGAPLLITDNIDVPLGISLFALLTYIIDLANGAIVEFYAFADKHGMLIQDEVSWHFLRICWSS